jgi:hypothetical protein
MMSVSAHDAGDPALTASVRVVKDPAELSAIHEPGTGVALWDRALPPSLQSWLNSLPVEQVPSTRTVLRPRAVPEAVDVAFKAAGTPEGAERDRLADDIAGLAEMFAGLMAVPYVRVRLENLRGDACTKFHQDRVIARLICTYRGPGTQYGLAHADGDPTTIHDVPAGVPAIFRGALSPAADQPPVVHRSPAIAGTGRTRLVLVIDPVADLSEG